MILKKRRDTLIFIFILLGTLYSFRTRNFITLILCLMPAIIDMFIEIFKIKSIKAELKEKSDSQEKTKTIIHNKLYEQIELHNNYRIKNLSRK